MNNYMRNVESKEYPKKQMKGADKENVDNQLPKKTDSKPLNEIDTLIRSELNRAKKFEYL